MPQPTDLRQWAAGDVHSFEVSLVFNFNLGKEQVNSNLSLDVQSKLKATGSKSIFFYFYLFVFVLNCSLRVFCLKCASVSFFLGAAFCLPSKALSKETSDLIVVLYQGNKGGMGSSLGCFYDTKMCDRVTGRWSTERRDRLMSWERRTMETWRGSEDVWWSIFNLQK